MRYFALAGALGTGMAFAQPEPPAAPYLACAQEPTGAAMNDTVVSDLDNEGYYSLFDGATSKGWWQSCLTNHNGPAKWKVVPEMKAIFSTQDGSKGGLLMTNKKFTNYELVWDYWPDFGNDGGIFNRTPANGRCFQTVLDYIGGASLGGTWGEGGFTSRDFRPFSFAGNEKTITIPGNSSGEPSNWTTLTSKMIAAGEKIPGCPTTGCTQTQWQSLWDFDGWNQLRLQFYGGVTGNTRVRMKFWFRKVGATDWTPVSYDTTLMQVIDPGYIGLQVHGGGRFGGARGTWYRNIKWTPLDGAGNRIIPVATRMPDGASRSDISAGSYSLVGSLDQDYEITLKNAAGRTLQVMKGRAGAFDHRFAPGVSGWIAMSIKTRKGVENRTFIRDIQ